MIPSYSKAGHAHVCGHSPGLLALVSASRIVGASIASKASKKFQFRPQLSFGRFDALQPAPPARPLQETQQAKLLRPDGYPRYSPLSPQITPSRAGDAVISPAATNRVERSFPPYFRTMR
jgi:hypothetical protein